MGAATGVIVIRTNPHTIDSSAIIKTLVSARYQELSKEPPFFDTRRDHCFRIFKEVDYVILDNAKFTANFFMLPNDLVGPLYKQFGLPKHFYALQAYDSSGTYGYSIYRSGKLERMYRESYGKVESYGQPMNIECKWLDLPEIKFEEEGEVYTGFIHPDNGRTEHKQSRSQFLFSEVVQHEIGFSIWDIGVKSKEIRYFEIR